MKYSLLALTAACLAFVPGCGEKSTTQGRLPISGKVTFKGSPLESGAIQFMPGDAAGMFGGGAVISQGEYSIAEQQGLPVGKYKVVISAGDSSKPAAEDEMPGESGPPAEELIPAEYNVESDKFVDVSADKENIFSFDIP